MKKLSCILLILLSASFVFGQITFDVQNFSEDYYGKVYLENPEEVFTKGWVAIYQKKTNKQLVKVNAEELIGDTEEGKMSEFSGDLSSKKGSLKSLSGENLTNITFNK